MKKLLKSTCAIALALTSVAGVSGATLVGNNNVLNTSNARQVAYAEGEEYLTIKGCKKTVSLGEEIDMPVATFGTANTAVTNYVVTTPSGKKITNVEGKLSIEEIGTYTIKYTYGAYAGEVSFEATLSSYTISLAENTERFLPNKVGTNYEGDLYVPSYKVLNEDGKDVTDSVDVKIVVRTPDLTANTLSVDENGKILFTEEQPLTKGIYIVNYSVYTKAEQGKTARRIAQTTKEFTCVSDYNNDLDLTLSYSKEKPESVNIGKTVELPAVTAKSEAEDIPVYYTVEVYKNGTDLISSDTKVGNTDTYVIKRNENGIYEFTANELCSYYTIKYKVKHALSNEETVASYNIDVVEDSLKPSILLVDGYDKTNSETLKTLENKDYDMKSYYGTADKVVVKAVYAEDLGTFDIADYTFKREVKDSSYETIYTDEENFNKDLVFNFDGEVGENQVKVDKELNVGTYRVYYTVTDKAGNKTTVNYKFTIEAGFNWTDENSEDVVPVVKFNDTFFENIDKGEVVEFGKVTASDDYDERLYTEVYYEYVNASDEVLETKALELNDSYKYQIDTALASEGTTKLYIYAKATNDGGNTNDYVAERIEMNVNMTEEVETSNPPAIESVGAYTSTGYTQGDEITLPEIVFTDDYTNTLNAEIAIVCVDGDAQITYDAYNAIAIRTGGKYYYQGGTFVAATKGNYQIAIKATDAQGNVAIKFLNYVVEEAEDTRALRFTNIGLTDTTLELGKSFKLPQAEIVGTGAENYTWEVRCVKSQGGYELNNDKFTAKKAGEYELEYVMLDSNGDIVEDQTVSFKITVEDTANPTILVDWQSNSITEPAKDSITGAILDAYAKGTKIELPTFSASDLSGIDTTKSNIVITCDSKSGTTTKTIKFVDMYNEDGTLSDSMTYTFSKDGEYKVTYTAYDKQGNSAKQTYTIKIGDLEAPELEVSDKIMKSSYKTGDVIKVDLTENAEYFTLTDADTSLEISDITVSLYVNGNKQDADEASKVSEGKYEFTLSEAGDYELRFTVKDSAGNETTETKTFTIKAAATSNMSSTEVVGTILIVVSVLVLGGVVVYFIVSKRKMDKLYKN